MQRAVLGLLELEPERVWQADGRIYSFALGDGKVQVSIRDEDGKIDLNEAPLELLTGLFTALGLEPEAAQTMAERIVDFRDPDHDPLPLGGEDPAYAAAGLPDGAANRPFVHEAELVRLLGMTEELYRRVWLHVTVYAASDRIDPARATRAVLEALPGITPDVVERLLASVPDDDPVEAIGDDALLEQVGLYWLPSRHVVFTIRAEARTPGGGHFVREAVVELDGDPLRPFLVHAWRRGNLDS